MAICGVESIVNVIMYYLITLSVANKKSDSSPNY